MPPEENEVKVQQDRNFIQRSFDESPLARLLSVASGERPRTFSDYVAGQQETPTYGLPGVIEGFSNARQGIDRGVYNAIGGLGNFFAGERYVPGKGLGDLMFDPAASTAAFGDGTSNLLSPQELEARKQELRENYTGGKDYLNESARIADEEWLASLGQGSEVAEPITNSQGQTFAEMVAANQFDGSAYDQAGVYMMERRKAQMRAVQDMYNQYAAETQSNVDRIGDIYGGAQEGVGQTYDSATGNIQDAYGSAQQQAADQMARLGIEEAAPKVIDPMALSQAEDLSSLETNRASTLGATEQFGATAGGFATNMAQVAQQGALENQRGATEQLADQLFELEMQRAEAQQAYNPYQRAMQELEAEQSFNQFYDPQPDPGAMQDQAEFLYRQEQDDATNFNKRVEFYASDLGGGELEEKQITAYEAAMRDAQTGMFGPRLKAEADQYFSGRQAGQ